MVAILFYPLHPLAATISCQYMNTSRQMQSQTDWYSNIVHVIHDYSIEYLSAINRSAHDRLSTVTECMLVPKDFIHHAQGRL